MGDSDDDELGEGGMRDERRRDTGLFENDGGDSDDGLLMDSGNRGRASSARGGSAGNNSAGSARRGRGGHTPVEHEEDDDDDLSLQQGSTAQYQRIATLLPPGRGMVPSRRERSPGGAVWSLRRF